MRVPVRGGDFARARGAARVALSRAQRHQRSTRRSEAALEAHSVGRARRDAGAGGRSHAQRLARVPDIGVSSVGALRFLPIRWCIRVSRSAARCGGAGVLLQEAGPRVGGQGRDVARLEAGGGRPGEGDSRTGVRRGREGRGARRGVRRGGGGARGGVGELPVRRGRGEGRAGRGEGDRHRGRTRQRRRDAGGAGAGGPEDRVAAVAPGLEGQCRRRAGA